MDAYEERRTRSSNTSLHASSETINSFGDRDRLDHTAEEDVDHRSRTNSRMGLIKSHDRLPATPPITIPIHRESAVTYESQESGDEESGIEHYMRRRQPSISFNNEIRTDSGHRQSVNEPLSKSSSRAKLRGRSMMQALAQAPRSYRSHSESDQKQYDPFTGRYLPKFSTSPPRDEPHIGESRFPLLQQTVDDMARESRPNLSLNTDSQKSPKVDRIQIPQNERATLAISPTQMSPLPESVAISCESPRAFRRTASERWKSGEAAQDFFSQARSSRRATGSWRDLRRDTMTSTKSPSSVASSFLRAFSVGSGGEDEKGSQAADAEGQTIGEDYVLGKQIGFGGFSIVREVTQLSSETGRQRKLAVKIVRRNIEGKSENDNEIAQAEFEHEVELWRFLSHPHILPLEAVYKLEEATFCFIPLNTGGTLFDIIRKHRSGLSVDTSRNYTYQIASALRYLHLDARVVHRDLKLENCLVDTSQSEPGIVRLCDFGMAEWISSDASDTQSVDRDRLSSERGPQKAIGPADSSTASFAGGSLEYAAPEIVQRATNATNGNQSEAAQRGTVSPAVDIWALGVCMYTLMVGKRPFSDTFMPKVVMAILAGDWDRDAINSKLHDHPDAEFAMEVLEGCLDMDERQRLRITDIMASSWLVEESKNHDNDDDDSSGKWRL